jgi:transcriptional regulator with PAS, ATPase and Fis domain
MVERGRFRQDLFFRINVVPLELPPLRGRKEDVIPLCHHFIKRLGGGKAFFITEGAARMLTSYPWPGNVRELSNTMERAMIFGGENGAITVETLSFLNNMNSSSTNRNGFQLPPQGISLDALLSSIVKQALDMSGNNQTRAAKLLGLTRAKFRVLHKNTQNGTD